MTVMETLPTYPLQTRRMRTNIIAQIFLHHPLTMAKASKEKSSSCLYVAFAARYSFAVSWTTEGCLKPDALAQTPDEDAASEENMVNEEEIDYEDDADFYDDGDADVAENFDGSDSGSVTCKSGV